MAEFHPDTPKNPTRYEIDMEARVAHLERRYGELKAERDQLRSLLETEVERLTGELANQEAVMVAADRLWTAYQAMLDGEDLGGLPDWERPSPEPPVGRLFVKRAEQS